MKSARLLCVCVCVCSRDTRDVKENFMQQITNDMITQESSRFIFFARCNSWNHFYYSTAN